MYLLCTQKLLNLEHSLPLPYGGSRDGVGWLGEVGLGFPFDNSTMNGCLGLQGVAGG